MPTEVPAFLELPLARLVRALCPQAVILFGSYAKGTAHPGSDVDLLVVAELPGATDTHMRRARQLTAGLFPPIDVVLCTPDDVADASKAKSPFLASVLSSGVTLYRRDPLAPGQ